VVAGAVEVGATAAAAAAEAEAAAAVAGDDSYAEVAARDDAADGDPSRNGPSW
jgi:uncharacterized low-complexity protein